VTDACKELSALSTFFRILFDSAHENRRRGFPVRMLAAR
jgi:hypothetical protein